MSHQYTYDNLDRLGEARRGVWSETARTFTAGEQSQKWLLDPLGNWNSFWPTADLDPFGSGVTFPSTLREDRAHNEVNELLERDLPGAGGELDLAYDAAGNLILQEREKIGGGTETVEYTWDAWNRLVRVEIDEDLRSETEYNGLTHRTVQRADTTGNGTLDQERRFTYDASWRIAEELVGPAGGNPARRVQHIWGNRYIDDLILRRIDRDLDDEYDEDWYHLTDVQFSTVAVIEPRTSLNARVHERVTYDAYGRARHHWGHDVNGDGAITTSGTKSDLSIIAAIVHGGGATITDASYRAEADINRDGVINGADEAALGSVKTALARGEISDRTSTGPDSIIGWCGYVFVPETKFYHVRFRVYDTGLRRWKSRDPLGYVDGMGLYEYVRGMPVGYLDTDGRLAVVPAPIVGCLGAGLLSGAWRGAKCFWSGEKNCGRKAGCAAAGGCIAGAIVGFFPSIYGGCIGAAAGAIAEALCNAYFGDPLDACTAADTLISAIAGCVGGALPLTKQPLDSRVAHWEDGLRAVIIGLFPTLLGDCGRKLDAAMGGSFCQQE